MKREDMGGNLGSARGRFTILPRMDAGIYEGNREGCGGPGYEWISATRAVWSSPYRARNGVMLPRCC